MVVCTSMMRKSNVFCRKLQLVVGSADTNTKQKMVHYVVEYIQHIVH